MIKVTLPLQKICVNDFQGPVLGSGRLAKRDASGSMPLRSGLEACHLGLAIRGRGDSRREMVLPAYRVGYLSRGAEESRATPCGRMGLGDGGKAYLKTL